MTTPAGQPATVHPQARFRGDLSSIIESHSVLRDHIRAFVNVNGYSLLGPSRFPGLAPYMAERRGDEWHTKLPNSESGGSFCAGINELLLRSPSANIDGRPLLRVFPAITGAWRDVRISRMRAQGAFLVTAERRDGQTAYVLIESEAGADCQLVSPWPGTAVTVESDGQPVAYDVDEGAISFATQRGNSYLIFATVSPPRDLEMVELEVTDDDSCRLGIGGPVDALSWRGYDPGLW